MSTAILRSRILDLAIRGQLVPQDPNEGTADDLLKTIATKRGKPITPITDNVPFEIPANWRWVKLGDMGIYRKGPFGSSLTKSMFVPKSDTTYKVYEQKNAINKNAEIGTYYISAEKYEEMKGFSVSPNDIIVSCAGTIGETFVIPQNAPKGIINQALMRVRLFNLSMMDYWLLYFDFVLRKESQNQSKGTAIKNIPPFEIFKQLPLPLPPLAEQHRIVAKVEELLSEVDKIEQAQTDITQAATILRSRVLDSALKGELTHSNTEEWETKTIKEIVTAIFDGDWIEKKDQASVGIRLIQTGNIGFGVFRDKADSYRYISESTFKEFNCSEIFPGDILVSRLPEPVGRACILPNTGHRMITAVDCSIIRLNEALVLKEYFCYYTQSPDYLKAVNKLCSGTTRLRISRKNLEKVLIPLPPLAEQRRIVAKLEELLSAIDNLK